MDEQKAKEVLDNVNEYYDVRGELVCLDGWFTAEQLEAIAWLMKNKSTQ